MEIAAVLRAALLFTVIENGDAAALKNLLSAGADPNAQDDDGIHPPSQRCLAWPHHSDRRLARGGC